MGAAPSLHRSGLTDFAKVTLRGGSVWTQRFAVRDFALRGKATRKGQMLMLALGGANRGPAVFPDPDVLDLDRDTREALAFGPAHGRVRAAAEPARRDPPADPGSRAVPGGVGASCASAGAARAPSRRAALHRSPAGLLFLARGRSASTGGRRSSLRAEVVTHLVNLVALLVMIIADDNYALAA